MKIIFTKSHMPLSKWICWMLKEPVSHTAFLFDDRWLFQSNLLGVSVHWYESWKKKQDVCYEITYQLDLTQEEEIFQMLLNQYSEGDYEYKGFLYFTWRALLKKFFNSPFPKKNKWGTRGLLCTEIAGLLPQWMTNLSPEVDLAITSPWTLYQMLLTALRGKS